MPSRRARPALIVAGMHRSGTSVVSLAIQQLGIDLGGAGDRSPHNPEGYGEDLEVVALHRRLFRAAFEGSEERAGHHHDWGYDPDETFDAASFGHIEEEVDAFLDRGDGDGPWGWKDPRTTLVLDQWTAALDDPRVLLVVRRPAEVAASMAALGEGPWQDPVLPHRIWRYYNRHVLRFARRTSVPCAIVHGSIGVAPPAALASVLRSRLGLDVDPTGVAFDHIRADRFAGSAPRGDLPTRDRIASELLWRRLDRRAIRPDGSIRR